MKTIEQTNRERLKVLIEEYGSQAALANRLDKNPAQISQWLNASPDSKTGNPRSMSSKTLREIESKTGKPIGWMDQRIDEDLIPSTAQVLAYNEYDHKDSHVEIEMFDVNLSAGLGNSIWIVRKSDEPLLFRKNWFKQKKLSSETCKAMYVRGDSMLPHLKDWDTVVIDTSDIDIIDGDIYAVAYKGHFYVKQIVRTEDGIELVSSNDAYKPIPIPFEESDKFQILGHLVWRGG